jgi:hypothetical protein
MAPVIQEIVSRSGWQTGNDVSVILHGTGTGSWGRKFVTAFEGNPSFAPRLVVQFNATGGGVSTPTNTATNTATASNTPPNTATPTNQPTATKTSTSTPLSPSPTNTPSSSQTVSISINNSTDDINEVNGSLEVANPTIWIGNGGSTTTSYTGLRFNNVTIPRGATILSARLEFYSVQSQWQTVNLQIAAEAANNSAAFSATSRPSQRSLTTARINHASNVPWSANTWYPFDEMAAVVQEVTNRIGWQSGNSLAIILRGMGTGTWGRKFVQSMEGGATNAARLVIAYRT